MMLNIGKNANLAYFPLEALVVAQDYRPDMARRQHGEDHLYYPPEICCVFEKFEEMHSSS